MYPSPDFDPNSHPYTHANADPVLPNYRTVYDRFLSRYRALFRTRDDRSDWFEFEAARELERGVVPFVSDCRRITSKSRTFCVYLELSRGLAPSTAEQRDGRCRSCSRFQVDWLVRPLVRSLGYSRRNQRNELANDCVPHLGGHDVTWVLRGLVRGIVRVLVAETTVSWLKSGSMNSRTPLD